MDFVDKISDWQSHARGQIKLIEMDPAPKEEDTKIAVIQPFINNVLEDEDLLLRYLLGNSCIYTGNDNSNDSEDDCYRASPFVWDDKLGSIPNPNHDIEHYDYYFKEVLAWHKIKKAFPCHLKRSR